MALSSASVSRFGRPPRPSAVLASARSLGARAVLVRRSSRSFTGFVAVPVIPFSAWGAPLGEWCASWGARLGVPVFVRRSARGLLPSVPVAPRSRSGRRVRLLPAALRAPSSPLAVLAARRPLAAAPRLPRGARQPGRSVLSPSQPCFPGPQLFSPLFAERFLAGLVAPASVQPSRF